MVSKFPTTIKIDVKINAVHNAMLSALEGTILDESDSFSEVHVLLAAAVLFIFGLCLISKLCQYERLTVTV